MKQMKKTAKPFVKWAGGKNQLLKTIDDKISTNIDAYIEPFIGGGAVFFHLLNNHQNLKTVVINDINSDLIDTYQTIKDDVENLILVLQNWQDEFFNLLNDEEKKKLYYYDKRTLFNQRISNKTIQSALFIFLNKTCFNGLYRVNRKNEFVF